MIWKTLLEYSTKALETQKETMMRVSHTILEEGFLVKLNMKKINKKMKLWLQNLINRIKSSALKSTTPWRFISILQNRILTRKEQAR